MLKSNLIKNKKKICFIFLCFLVISIILISLVFVNNNNNNNNTESKHNHDYLILSQYPKGIRLTIKNNINNSIMISWYNEIKPEDPKVKYSINADLSESQELRAKSTKSDNIYICNIELMNLFTNTTYYYQVYSDAIYYRGIMSFTTLLNYTKNFKFLVFGDTQSQRSVRALLSENILTNFGKDFDFIIHTGDIVSYGSKQSEWNEYFSGTECLAAYKPCFYSEGNHEEGLETKMYNNLPMISSENKRYYSFTYNNIGFIILNSNIYATSNNAQSEWLNKTLINFSQENVFNFVFMHHPLLHSGDSEYRNWSLLFEKYNVSIIFSGHNHHYERSFPIINSSTLEFDNSEYFNYLNLTNPIYIITGGGGAPLESLKNDAFIATKIKAYNFLIVEINKERDQNTISFEVWVMIENTETLFLYESVSIINWY